MAGYNPQAPASAQGTTYGALTNAQILALTGLSENDTTWSIDDNITYTYYSGSWYSTLGGVLV